MFKSRKKFLFPLLLFIAMFAGIFAGCSGKNQGFGTGNGEEDMQEEKTVYVYCKENALEIALEKNASAAAFYEKLKEGDVTLSMHDYGNFEKVGELGFSLPETNKQITTVPGDVILYRGTDITIYYDVNSWNFTLLGKIAGMTRESMLAFFGGTGEVEVRFSLNEGSL